MINKVWKVVGRDESYSDRELKKMIIDKKISEEDLVYSDEIKDPIKLTNGSEVTLTVSIGVAEYPEAADMALELCNCAEVVMVRVKENGKNNIGYYDSKVLEEFKEAVNFENKLNIKKKRLE